MVLLFFLLLPVFCFGAGDEIYIAGNEEIQVLRYTKDKQMIIELPLSELESLDNVNTKYDLLHSAVLTALKTYPISSDIDKELKKIRYDFEDAQAIKFDDFTLVKLGFWDVESQITKDFYSDYTITAQRLEKYAPVHFLFYRTGGEGFNKSAVFCSYFSVCETIKSSNKVLDIAVHPTLNCYFALTSYSIVTLNIPSENNAILVFNPTFIKDKSFQELLDFNDGAIVLDATKSKGYYGFGNFLYSFTFDINEIHKKREQQKFDVIQKIAKEYEIPLKPKAFVFMKTELLQGLQKKIKDRVELVRLEDEINRIENEPLRITEWEVNSCFKAQPMFTLEEGVQICGLFLLSDTLAVQYKTENKSGYKSIFFNINTSTSKQLTSEPGEAFEVTYALNKKQMQLLPQSNFISARDVAYARGFHDLQNYHAMTIDAEKNIVLLCSSEVEKQTEVGLVERHFPIIKWGDFIPKKMVAPIQYINKQVEKNQYPIYDALYLWESAKNKFNSKVKNRFEAFVSPAMKAAVFPTIYNRMYSWYSSLGSMARRGLNVGLTAGVTGFAAWLYSKYNAGSSVPTVPVQHPSAVSGGLFKVSQ